MVQLIGLHRRGLPMRFSIICIGTHDPVSNPGVGNIVSMTICTGADTERVEGGVKEVRARQKFAN